MARRAEALRLARRLEAWGDERQWCGTDPYEGLNAARLVGPLRRSALGRRLLIQTVKRSPVDVRPLLGICPGRNAATIAWIASAYARGSVLERREELGKLRRALALLDALRSPSYEVACWGYHFDFQSRVLFYPHTQPNTIATAFGGMALLDAHRALGDSALLEQAREVGQFLVRHIPQTPDPPGAYFGYVPGDRSPVHNASMLVCALLARLGAEFHERAEAALEYTVARQRPDGSWPYGERPGLGWVDNFHTGYVLDSLRACADAGLAPETATPAWERGLSFYRSELFLSDGTPKYYSNRTYPLDSQCAAQAIQTFSIAAAHDRSFRADAWRVCDFALRRMRRADGVLMFQRRRLWVNRAAHMRWVVAPMLLALTHLLGLDEGEPVPVASDDAILATSHVSPCAE
jgi:hypothetical protein